jgi:hypothetical protein
MNLWSSLSSSSFALFSLPVSSSSTHSCHYRFDYALDLLRRHRHLGFAAGPLVTVQRKCLLTTGVLPENLDTCVELFAATNALLP